MLELHATFSGVVQGVGFRATTSIIAKRLGLTGLVRNKSDGSVEIVAQGEKLVLEKLVASLREAFDQIEDMQIQYIEPKNAYEDFRIDV